MKNLQCCKNIQVNQLTFTDLDIHNTDCESHVSVGVAGVLCQFWSSQSPHSHQFTNVMRYPDASIEDAHNFCRSPYNRKRPWCYTTDPNYRVQLCDTACKHIIGGE